METNNLVIPTSFNVRLYGELEQITPTLSKCRVRTFYKYFNRNRTYISEEFAQELVDSLPYAPIKGIYDNESEDYTDHGNDNTDGRIYGVIMADPNFAWEDHEDDDGIVRTYACADALIYTGLYPEASQIIGKSQSMEIYKGNLKGEWRTWNDGKPYYHFLHGCLVGLQVLGDDTEPCFQGAAFFSLCKDVQEAIAYIKSIQDKEGKKEMDNEKEVVVTENELITTPEETSAPEEIVVSEEPITESQLEQVVEVAERDSYDKFRLSDREKAMEIESQLNGDGERYFVFDVYDDYAICRDFEDGKFLRVYYTKSNDVVTLGEVVEVVMTDITKDELLALEAIKAAAGTYQIASEKLSVTVETSNFELKDKEIEELKTTISDFTSKEEAWNAEKIEMEKKISDITNENESLTSFKKQVELKEKEAILAKYEEHLTDSIYTSLKESIDKFSIEEFNKEVCTAVIEAGALLKEENLQVLIPKVQDESTKRHLTGAESILAKYYK